jgi:predicted DNA-binding transcriptional regulator YafY
MPPTKVQRQIDVIAYLVGRHLPVSVEELMRKIPAYAEKWETGEKTDQATARRTFERDKDDLRKFGIPLRTVKYTVDGQDMEGYEIARRDFYLPYLKLISGEAEGSHYASRHRVAEVQVDRNDAPLALKALRRLEEIPSFPFAAEARSAFRKLAFDLDPEAFGSGAAASFIDGPDAAELDVQLRLLSDALLARKRIRFRYHGIQRAEPTERDVTAYGLIFQAGQWYLIGHDATRDDVRVFRVGRMQDIVANKEAPNTPDYEIPNSFRLRDYIGRRPWELGSADDGQLVAHVHFRFPHSLWAERNKFGRLLETQPDGSTLRAFDIYQTQPFLRWILSLESDAEIVTPPHLQAQLQQLARAVAVAHRGSSDDHQ